MNKCAVWLDVCNYYGGPDLPHDIEVPASDHQNVQINGIEDDVPGKKSLRNLEKLQNLKMFSNYVQCNNNNIVLIIFWNFLEMGLLSDFPHTSFNSLQFCWCSWDSWSLLIKRRHTPQCILDLKQGGTSMKIVKVANYRCFVPLCNDDKQWDSGQDLSFFKFPRDEPKVHCTIFRICYLFRVLCFCLSSLVWIVTVW